MVRNEPDSGITKRWLKESPPQLYRAQRKRAEDAENVDVFVVYERDGWVCQLCGDGIDRDIAWPHPMSKSVDHIIPVSMGGAHTYENLRAAHLRCNIQEYQTQKEM